MWTWGGLNVDIDWLNVRKNCPIAAYQVCKLVQELMEARLGNRQLNHQLNNLVITSTNAETIHRQVCTSHLQFMLTTTNITG